MKVYKQGDCDALCGVYAIMNAFALCGVAKPQAIYEASIKALVEGGMANELVKGAELQAEVLMVQACLRLPGTRKLSLSTPFAEPKTHVDTDSEFWSRLETCFRDEGAQVVIQGAHKPYGHWIAFKLHAGRKVTVFDSNPEKRKGQYQLVAGHNIRLAKRGPKSHWLLTQTETLVILKR